MLIKLACGYEINPELIDCIYTKDGSEPFVYTARLTLPLTPDELAKIRAYHKSQI